MTMTVDHSEHLQTEKDRLSRLIASVGNAAPKQWHLQLEGINERMGQKDFGGASVGIRRFKKNIKRWMLIRGGQLLMIILVLLMIIEIVHWYLMKLEHRAVFEHEACNVIIDYPRFTRCHEYFEVFICIERKGDVGIQLEMQPSSNEYWIRGDNWQKDIEKSTVSRSDWRPEILYKPEESFLKIMFSPYKWPYLYPRGEIVITLRDATGVQMVKEIITLRAIRFYYQLTGIIAILIISSKVHKYRLISIFQYVIKR